MGAGASAPTGVGSSPAPIVAPPVSTPIATPTATPSSTPQGGKGGPTAAGTSASAPVTQSVAPTAPQQPQYNPFMQTYGQNNTPQQQSFNRFQPQQFQQPQQYGRFGQQAGYGQQRGFMPQNRGGYERQMDQLRGQGQYGQQYPQKQLGFMSDLMSGREQPFVEPAYNGPTQAQWGQMQNQPVTSYEARPSFGESQQTGVSQLNPFQAALVKGGTPYVQGAPGAPYAIGQGIPGGAPGGYMPLMNSNGTPVSSLASANPAGGKGGNPTSNVPISTYI